MVRSPWVTVSNPDRRLIGSSTVAFSAVGVSPCSTGSDNCWVLVSPQNSRVDDDPRSGIDSVVVVVVVLAVESEGALGSAGAAQDSGTLFTKNPTTPASAITRPRDFRNFTGTVCIVESASTPITEMRS
ncbi:hypothetical protein MAHJHV51_24830 [Mycobacterium avium subsp. hominissuis]